MSDKIVSFIIPAYNAADTIVRCLESIRNLSLEKKDYEIIVVDDASTDETVSIIGNWTLENGDCRLEILRQPKNNRQGAARNRGVSVAKGEYICFVDSDDAVTEGVVDAIRLAKETQTDMVSFHMAFINENGMITKEQEHLSFPQDQIFSGIELQNKHPYWCSGPVAYIYNKAFLDSVDYPFHEGVLYEDSDFIVVHLYHAKRMIYSPALGYFVYCREGSTTHSKSYKNVADYLLLGTRMLDFYDRISQSNVLMESGVEQFAEGILEGACWNVHMSCRRIIKLSSISDVMGYYTRIDEHIDRKKMCADKRLRTYFWNAWTSLCLNHKNITIVLLSLLIPIYKIVKR